MVNLDGISVEVLPRARKRPMGREIRDAATMRRVRDLLMAHLAKNGATATEIGSLFGISSKTVRTRVGLVSDSYRVLPDEFSWTKRRSVQNQELMCQSINHLRKSGLTVGDIAWVMGISESTVRRS